MSVAPPELWRSLWPRFGRVFPLELVLSLAVMAVAWGVLAWAAAPGVFKARFAETWMMLGTARVEMVERLAYGVDAPKSEADERRDLSRYVSSQRIVGETVVFAGEIHGTRYEIGFYPALAGEGAVARWVCGRAAVPEGFTARAPAATSNLPEALLGSSCRARRG
ncbi:MAG: hypothetical protein ACT4P3_19410 [Betaproteobacteria bacterium]